MNKQYIPTAEDLKNAWYLWRRPFLEKCLGWMTHDMVREITDLEIDLMLTSVRAEVWDEGRRAEETAWMHAFDGHPVEEGEICYECEVENPYRKVVPNV